ncbi:TY-Chap domain-containing protein [Streptomyces sp. NPDC050145]|uniref:TY-Chap domain-containing protein n=1 Tax=Streptomyces sp. NPDC050145 TaxID=3365602 RepID=UPI0037922D8D
MDAEWGAFQKRLREALTGMVAGETLVVSEPDPEPDAGRGLWRRWSKSRRSVGRYVQFIAWDEGISAECVSRAHRATSDEQERRLLELGWSDPRTHPRRSGRSSNHEMEIGLDEVDRLAHICAQSLRVLDEDPPNERWTWQKFSSADTA